MNRATGNTPSTLLFGVDQKRRIQHDLTDYLQGLDHSGERDHVKLREAAEEQMKKQMDYNKRAFDRRCTRNTNYEKGDLVMLRKVNIVGERNKLKPKFRGPYEVKKVLDRNRYVVGDIDGYQVSGRRFEGIFDPSNMRLYQKVNCPSEERMIGVESDVEYQDIEYLDEEEMNLGSEIEYEDIEYLDEANDV